jgi:hypothetical protein
MFTRLKMKLVGNAPVTTSSPSGDTGSQPVLAEVSPGKAAGKKRAMKVGSISAVPEVVAVPFGSLPGDFGIQPLPTKELSLKRAADE